MAIDPHNPHLNRKWCIQDVDEVIALHRKGYTDYAISMHFKATDRDIPVNEVREIIKRNERFI